jgi:hypothetical protein
MVPVLLPSYSTLAPKAGELESRARVVATTTDLLTNMFIFDDDIRRCKRMIDDFDLILWQMRTSVCECCYQGLTL